MGHSSLYHLRLLKKVFISFSNFHHLLPSMRGVNPENFSFIAITSQILCSFKVLGIFVNFVIFDFLLISEACQLKILLVVAFTMPLT